MLIKFNTCRRLACGRLKRTSVRVGRRMQMLRQNKRTQRSCNQLRFVLAYEIVRYVCHLSLSSCHLTKIICQFRRRRYCSHLRFVFVYDIIKNVCHLTFFSCHITINIYQTSSRNEQARRANIGGSPHLPPHVRSNRIRRSKRCDV